MFSEISLNNIQKYDFLTYHIQFDRYHRSLIVKYKISFEMSSTLMLKRPFQNVYF